MSIPKFNTLLLEVTDHICTLTINRPDKLNALNNQVLDELAEAVDFIEGNDDIRAVIITGSGEKAFVAGADIAELSTLDEESGTEAAEKGQNLFSDIESLSKPVIAVVNGYALGGGTELALSCHIRLATQNAVFGLPEVSLGLIPGYGGTQRLPKLIGRGRALELILTGRMVKAEEAGSLGIANYVLPGKDEALTKAQELIGMMTKHAPIALSGAISAIVASQDYEAEDGYVIESNIFGDLCGTEDFKEGTGAFLEKRKPKFTGN
ncbi:enoyl-CoA hydratase [Cyclonatronum proteinivorum]|uniref:Enoyl-CoA hydratase n=1 Tax=Cyclonatronum proteinivorum TaxID=1457365 RepID=A0A345UKB7_9BACT|nr:enoyl-CoA hydratase-related protein [Cyclonatronum proteinivorum]AXJ00919.1 enoyl-CoA hydratase [Cyclonatronum proteinivorum]